MDEGWEGERREKGMGNGRVERVRGVRTIDKRQVVKDQHPIVTRSRARD